MKIHFDGDLVVYRAGFAAEKMRYYIRYLCEVRGLIDEQFENKKAAVAWCDEHDMDPSIIGGDREVEPVANALHNVKSILSRTMEALDSDNLTVYLSGPTNFRDGIATIRPYKGNRDEAHKPVHGPAIKEYLLKHYDCVVSEDEEADDVVAYSHYRMWLDDDTSTVLCSTDKDLNMIPGMHYNFVKEAQWYITEEEADRFFMLQLLMGDSTDNIQGVPGLGVKRAEALLKDSDYDWNTVAHAYMDSYGEEWYNALVENGQLLWMRREPNQWWSPPEELTCSDEASA